MIYRSSCMEALARHVPQLAPLAAAQWQNMDTRVWQTCKGVWRQSSTARGGWQGSRFMQVAFCVGLESTLRRAIVDQGVSRVGYQDDQYIVGSAARQLELWPSLKCCLALDGHKLSETKCQMQDMVSSA